MQFHQVIVSANPGDAITTAAYELRALLLQVGPSEIYSRYVHPDLQRSDSQHPNLQNSVSQLRDFAHRRTEKPANDVMIYHASIGEPEVTRFVANRPERLIVIYHNISPSERFLAFDPGFAGLLAAGRMELASLADKAVLAITVSEYNAIELRELGFGNVCVSPLIIDIERLKASAPNASTMNHFAVAEGPVVLFVGQMLPHKRPELLVEAYHILVTYLIPEAMLVLVGNHRLPRFSEQLEHQLNELNLYKAWLPGAVSLDMLAAFYRSASVFVTLSEHEGFCVPLIEAMGFDVPVVARAVAAVPETTGGAAVLLPDEDDPSLAAEAMAEVIQSAPLRKQLIGLGRERVALHDPDVARAELVTRVFEVAPP